MSSDLFVPFFAGRALDEVRAFQDGVLPHPVLDADDRLLQTLLLVQLRLFLGFLLFQRLGIREKVRLVGARIGGSVVIADDYFLRVRAFCCLFRFATCLGSLKFLSVASSTCFLRSARILSFFSFSNSLFNRAISASFEAIISFFLRLSSCDLIYFSADKSAIFVDI